MDFTNPDEVDQWVMELLSEHPRAEVVRRVWAAVAESNDDFPFALVRSVLRLEGADALHAAIESGQLADPPDFHPAASSILRGEPVSDEQTRSLLEPAFAELELAAALTDPTVYAAFGSARRHGIDLTPLLRSPALRMDPTVRSRVEAANPDPGDRRRARRAERMCAYQSSVLRRGRMLVDDPRNGERARYLGYLVSGDVIAYRFGHDDSRSSDFYLLTRGPAGQLRSVYLPDRDLLLDLDAGQFPIRPLWPAVKMQLARALLEHSAPLPGDAPARTPGKPRVTVRVGGAQNFAHVLWNYYGGLAREEFLGNLPQAQRVLDVGSGFFGRLNEIYPEIGSVRFMHVPRAGRTGQHIDDPRRILIPIGSTLLWPEALDRVAGHADSLRDDPVVAGLRGQLSRHRIRLYVALRVRDKAWADADEQLPRLIDKIVSRHPDACVLLDGFSVPSGPDHVTGRWEGQQRELRDLVDIVRSRVRDPERVVDLVGLDMLRSIAVMRESTHFLSPIGTAHHKVDWFCEIPGVLYISEQMRDRKEPLPGHRLRRSPFPPRIVVGKDLGPESVRIQRPEDRRGSLANFTLSWRRVWAQLRPMLK